MRAYKRTAARAHTSPHFPRPLPYKEAPTSPAPVSRLLNHSCTHMQDLVAHTRAGPGSAHTCRTWYRTHVQDLVAHDREVAAGDIMRETDVGEQQRDQLTYM